ncbi:MAG: PaaI family thioesterase [Ottowia sp.]|uniref:PaaI family thioesterase n=1 Tax=unclassified Ottowia TaxID=2645081 RepID=UPI003C2D5EE6
MDYGTTIPFIDLLGITLERFEGGESVLHFAPGPEHCNSFNVAHGGSLMTLLDATMAIAARSVDKDSGVITIEMKTSFMRPAPVAKDGEHLVGKGKLLHRTGSMAFVEGMIYDPAGQLCVMATGTFKYVPRAARPDGGEVLSTD